MKELQIDSGDIQGLLLVFNMIRDSLKYFSEKYDLSGPEMGIVFDILTYGELSVTDISDLEKLPKSTISRLVEQLVQRGVLNRERLVNNRRTVKITITEEFSKRITLLKDDQAFQDVLEKNYSREDGKAIIKNLIEITKITNKYKKRMLK